ncbi:MAG: 1-acyl-sn-glycerol-3-phosphate acyltransferase [Halocynthiibacter sp.]
MPDAITLPFWLVALLGIAAISSSYHHVFGPLMRWYLRGREVAIKERLSQNLSRDLPEILRIRRKARVTLFVNKPEVRDAIDAAVHDGQGTHEILETKVEEYANELTPGFYALWYFKIGYYLARTYLRMLYDIRIAKQPDAKMGEIASNASVVLVGNHRSNIDVMLQAYLASRTNMISFAAGEWGKAWPMSALLRMSGSYIIRRAEPLPLYRKILAIHLRDMVSVKMPQGIFLEGSLTRDGGIQEVKLGLMSYILSALGHENVDDIVFVPIAMNYDQVPEDRALVKTDARAFQGRSKFYVVFSTLWSLLRMAYRKLSRGKSAYGAAAVSFGTPVSMKEWLQNNNYDMAGLSAKDRRAIVAPVAQDLIEDIKGMLPVLPMSVVGTVFAQSGENTLERSAVYDLANGVIDAMERNGATFSQNFASQSERFVFVEKGIEALKRRKVLLEHADVLRLNVSNRPLLDYVFHSTEHLL